MKIIDFFCGCGGLSLGFQKAGFDIIEAHDNWDKAIENYKNNFPHPVFKTDLSDWEAITKNLQDKAFDGIIGGPPCQDFSSAGKREEGDRANLTQSYARIVQVIHPRFFVMENVARSKNSGTYKEARARFKASGYGLTEMVLDASKCGVPQLRKRFFCVGFLGAEDGFLDELLYKKMSTTRMTVRDYLGSAIGAEHYYRHPRNYDRRGIFSIDEPSETIRGVNRPIPDGYKGHRKDSTDLNDSLRALTTEERASIQTFPDTYKWTGSKTEIEQMIGNAVPVNLGQFVASAVREYCEGSREEGSQCY